MFGILLGIVLTSGIVSAEFWACFNEGEFIDYCNPLIPDRTAPNNGYSLCMNDYNDENECWISGSYPVCLTLPLECSGTGGGSVDEDPPVLEVFSPEQDAVYSNKNILLDVESSEQADISYHNEGDVGPWKQVCNNCWSYSGNRNFQEGLNDLTFKAVDNAGNIGWHSLQFRVDSQKPQVKKTEPKNGFASGDFHIEFKEGNPTELMVHFGNGNFGFVEHEVDLTNECENDDVNFECDTNADLSPYDNQNIEYYVILKDIAGNLDQSNTEDLSVDYTPPKMDSFEYDVNGKYVTFVLEVSELNFDRAQYMDNTDLKPKWNNLCTKLDENNVCEKKVSFNDGTHDVNLRVLDKAGNEVVSSTTFFTDSMSPKIKDVGPSKDFASGFFEVEFDEENVNSLTLHYGNDLSGYGVKEVDIAGDCDNDEGKHNCLTEVSLDDYDGEEMEYWFVVRDLAGQEDVDGADELMVDISPPTINSFEYEVGKKSAIFNIEITELNFHEVQYIDNLDPKGKWKKLCSKLSNGVCEKKINLNDGPHDVNIQVFDKAGNSVGTSVQFLTDSKKPKIISIEPSKNFANGFFDIEIKEINLDSVYITYGNDDTGFFEYTVDLIDECEFDSNDKYMCTSFIDLGLFEGEKIGYFVEVYDILDQKDSDKEDKLIVDTVLPVINSLDYNMEGNKVTFIIDIIEENFDGVEYYDDGSTNPKWKTLCTSLDSGVCDKKLSFNIGFHSVDFRVRDGAGNVVFDNVEFTI